MGRYVGAAPCGRPVYGLQLTVYSKKTSLQFTVFSKKNMPTQAWAFCLTCAGNTPDYLPIIILTLITTFLNLLLLDIKLSR
jgi:hypothetical protein